MKEYSENEIGKYLAGELTASEREAFISFMHDNPDFRQEVEVYQKIWNAADTSPVMNWDLENARQKMSFTRQSETSVKRISLAKWLIPAAAAVLVLLALPFIFKSNQADIYIGKSLANGTLTLEDGSKIYLKPESVVTVHPFQKNKRFVELSGEAFFEVAPDKLRPFIIETKDVKTEVVGTSFNLKQDFTGTSIYVQTGKVIFSSLKHDDMVVALVAGEAAIAANDQISTILNPSPNTTAWHTRKLQFKSIPLETAVNDISEFFSKKITIEENAVKHCRITIPRPFTEPEIMSVLKSVAVSIQGTVILNGDNYVIRGGNCD